MIGQFLARLLVIMGLLFPGGAMAAGEDTLLLMGEQRGCIYCARWDADVAPEYAKTAEGRSAPLLRVDIHEPLPENVDLAGPLRITPTFVLLRNGREISRIEGYPGEDFFWGLLQRMLDDAGIDYGAGG
ncbi:hypothetical protein [Psychromarinibacter sp. S121]|uniref:hypothetical protein n=1 Tax=Psychromarinibacter sp. S121 TaxID=3415127 RepID=UPI003C7EB9A1